LGSLKNKVRKEKRDFGGGGGSRTQGDCNENRFENLPRFVGKEERRKRGGTEIIKKKKKKGGGERGNRSRELLLMTEGASLVQKM